LAVLSCLGLFFYNKRVSFDKNLYFKKYHINLGELDFNKTKKINFYFKNFGSHSVRIRSIEVDCSCLKVSPYEKEVSAGKAGVINAIFVANQIGSVNRKIMIITDDASQKVIRLSVSAIVKEPPVKVVPPSITFGRVLGVQNAGSKIVSITSNLDRHKIMSAVSCNSYIKASILKNTSYQSREVGRIKVILCGEPPSGRIEGEVIVKIQTAQGVVKSTIKVSADIVDAVEIIPPKLVMVNKGNNRSTRELIIKKGWMKNFSIIDYKIPPYLNGKLYTIKDNHEYSLAVTLLSNYYQTLDGEIIIYVHDGKSNATVKVPVLLHIK